MREANADIKQQAVSGMLSVAGSRLASRVLGQLFTIFLIRLLAPGDFGLMAMAGIFTSLFNMFQDMGLARAVVQRAEIDDEYLSTAFWGNLASGVVLCAVGVAGAVVIARIFNQPLVQPVFAALSVRFIFAGASTTQSAILSRELKFFTLASRSVASVVVGGAVGLGMALLGAGVWSLVGQTLATSFALMVLLWLATSWHPKRLFSWTKFTDLWQFGSNVLGSRIFSYAIKYADNFFIGRALGATMLGFYAFGYVLFLSPMIDTSIIVGRIVFSAFSRLQDDADRLRRGFMLTTRYLSFFIFPSLVGFFLVAEDLVSTIFGDKWLPAVPVVRVLIVAGLLASHSNIWASVFTAMGKPEWLFRWSFVSACLYVPAFYIGLHWGIVGVAVGYTLSTLLLVPVQLALVQRLLRFGMGEYLRVLGPVIIASAVMGVCVFLSQVWLTGEGVPASIRLISAVIVGVSTYMLAIVLIQRQLLIGLVGILSDLRRPQRRRRLAEEAL
ncbi:MAG: lipopolysaccharide biosynthesis protein [Armatimonadota bacterium]